LVVADCSSTAEAIVCEIALIFPVIPSIAFIPSMLSLVSF
jgi:hypothetical protein